MEIVVGEPGGILCGSGSAQDGRQAQIQYSYVIAAVGDHVQSLEQDAVDGPGRGALGSRKPRRRPLSMRRPGAITDVSSGWFPKKSFSPSSGCRIGETLAGGGEPAPFPPIFADNRNAETSAAASPFVRVKAPIVPRRPALPRMIIRHPPHTGTAASVGPVADPRSAQAEWLLYNTRACGRLPGLVLRKMGRVDRPGFPRGWIR